MELCFNRETGERNMGGALKREREFPERRLTEYIDYIILMS